MWSDDKHLKFSPEVELLAEDKKARDRSVYRGIPDLKCSPQWWSQMFTTMFTTTNVQMFTTRMMFFTWSRAVGWGWAALPFSPLSELSRCIPTTTSKTKRRMTSKVNLKGVNVKLKVEVKRKYWLKFDGAKIFTWTRLLRRFMASAQAGCSGDSLGSLWWIASVSRGSLVILCIGNIRKECIASDWHAELLSNSFKASTNFGFSSLSRLRVRSWYTWLEQYLT